MLRLLTDEHVSPAVAEAARRACPGIRITAIREWQHGHLLGAPDDTVLHEAHHDGLTLVTFDLRTIPPLLRAWAEQQIDHGGVVLVDGQTIRQADVGGLAAALCALFEAHGRSDWTNRVVFLRRGAC
jgi:ABC-type transporter Mla MlaB component